VGVGGGVGGGGGGGVVGGGVGKCKIVVPLYVMRYMAKWRCL